MGEPSAPTKPPQPMRIADALRRWLEQNEGALNLLVGSGHIVLRADFDTNANNGQGMVKVRLGM
jgi:hypothetical protein